MSRRAIFGIGLALLVGAMFRLIWPADMEFKGDEIYTFERTQNIGVTESWPWIGMSNSADVPHPGMSVWVFVGLARLMGSVDPVTLNIACMALNVVALFMLAGFVAKVVPAAEREPWWWAVTLVAVNPLAVLFHRKIWPPSVLPAITVLLLIGWWHRDRKPWAFFWGFTSAIATQIHPGAFFFSAGMAVWCLLVDRQSMRWLGATLGAIVGSITAWPWVYYLLATAERSAAQKAQWFHPFELRFWIYWFTEPFGMSLQYSLGNDFYRFMRNPIIGGTPTYLVAWLHWTCTFAIGWLLAVWCLKRFRNRDWSMDRSPTGLTIGAVMFGYGGLLTLSCLPVYRHYMIITFPLMFVWLARTALQSMATTEARRFLGGLCVVQACVTALFLSFVHQVDRPIRGDYGAPYRVQIATITPTQSAAHVAGSPAN